MAKKNRPSVLKRQREADKRQRQDKKATKAALKRERRQQRGTAQSPIVSDHDFQQIAKPLDLNREATDDANASASGPEAKGPGGSASQLK